ncbi:MAG: hypothetical protein IJV70_01845 [Clostridia bacterium]|nr:hypothetical protein [Clostridia bacterium]
MFEERKMPRVTDFTLLIIGALFMINPMIAFVDVIPDFFGCALIVYALHRLSSVSPELEEAEKYFKYMIFASAGRVLILFANPGFDDVMLLTMAMVFGVIDVGIMLAGMPVFYEGLAYLNVRYGGKAQEMPEFKIVGIAFIGARGFLSMLPYIESLMIEEQTDESISAAVDELATGSYTLLLMLVNVVVTLIFAAFWIVMLWTYLRAFIKDREFCERVYAAYEEKNHKEPEFFLRRTLLFAVKILMWSAPFLFDLLGDGKNVIPDVIFAVGAVWAAWILRKRFEDMKPVMISGAVYGVLSVVNFFVYNGFMQKRFFARFDMVLIRFASEYYVAIAFSVIETVALIVFAYYLRRVFMPMVETHSVQIVPREFVRSARNNEIYVQNSHKLLNAYTALLVTVAVSGTGLTALLLPFPEYHLIHTAFNIAFFVVSLVLTSRMEKGILARYERASDV